MRANKTLSTRAVALAGAMLLAGLTSCGVGAAATDNLSEADKTRIAEEYRDCLAEYGLEGAVSFENGAINVDIGVSEGTDAADLTNEELLAAEAECEMLLEDLDAGTQMDPEEEAQLIDAGPALQRCLNEKGYDVQVSADGGIDFSSDDQTEQSFDETEYIAAEEDCYQQVVPELWEKYGEGN